MKKIILTFLFAVMFLSRNYCVAQTPLSQINTNSTNSLSSSASPTSNTPPSGAAQIPTALAAQAPANLNPAASASPAIAAPADIASLTAKEILSANNQVVSQIASMYQHFGLFITIIVALAGGIATWMSYLARKSVHEFIEEWKHKMESIETEMKGSLERLRVAGERAEESAKTAGGHAQSLADSKTVLSKTLEDVDRLRGLVASLSAQLNAQQPVNEPPQQPAAAASAPLLAVPQTGDEDAQVAARLKGKINPGPGEGKTA